MAAFQTFTNTMPAAGIQTFTQPMGLQGGVQYAQAAPVTYAQAPIEYVQQAPAVEYIQQAPVQYLQQAPVMMTQEIDKVDAYGRVVERDFITQAAPRSIQGVERNLLAMGNVVSERVITIEELAAMDRYAEAPAVQVAVPRAPVMMTQEIDKVDAYGRVVERDFITQPMMQQAPMVEYVSPQGAVEYIQPAPAVEYVQAAPAVTYAQQPMMTMQQPMTYAQPTTMMQQPMTMGQPMMTMQQPMTFLG